MESALLATQLGTSYILAYENSTRTQSVCADAYQLWSYNFYPHYPDLAAIAERGAQDLGGSTMPIPGGRLFQGLAKVVGWKSAKQMHTLAYSIGYAKMLGRERMTHPR